MCKSGVLKLSGGFVLILGLAALGVAVFIPMYANNMLQQGIYEQVTIRQSDIDNNNDNYAMFADNSKGGSSPPTFKVYMYNITNNISDIIKGAKPVIEEVGPYVYKEHKVRFNITLGPDYTGKQVLRFKTWLYYEFDPIASGNLSESDVFVSANLLYNALKVLPFAQVFAFKSDEDRLFVTKSMHELIWGYEVFHISYLDPTTNKTQNFSFDFPGLLGNSSKGLEGAMVDPDLKHDAFYTGEKPYENMLRQYSEFQEQSYVSCWESPSANRVYGTDALQFHPNIDKDEILTVWVDNVFREAGLRRNSTVTFKGIDLYRFQLMHELLLPPSEYPPNADYWDNHPPGVFNISSCVPVEVFISKPHFLNADPYYASKIIDPVIPDVELYQTVIDVEPISGFTMRAKKRLQMNLHVHNYTIPIIPSLGWNQQIFENIHDLYLPIAWAEESGEIADKQASEFTSSVYVIRKVSYYVQYAGMIGGEIFVLLGLFMVYWGHRKASNLPTSELHPEYINTEQLIAS